MLGRFSPGVLGSLLPLVLLPGFCFGASVQKPATDMSARDCAQMAQPYVVERLAVWQQRLKLEDWKISVIMSHPSDLKPKTLGNIHWDADRNRPSFACWTHPTTRWAAATCWTTWNSRWFTSSFTSSFPRCRAPKPAAAMKSTR